MMLMVLICSPSVMKHPYPSEEEKKQLAAETNLTLLQVKLSDRTDNH